MSLSYPQLGQDDGRKILNLLRVASHTNRTSIALQIGVRVGAADYLVDILIDNLLQPLDTILVDGLAAKGVHACSIQHFQTSCFNFATLPLPPHEGSQTREETFVQEQLRGEIWGDGECCCSNTKGNDVIVISASLDAVEEEA